MSIGEILPGQTIAGCHLLRLLGQGNNSQVYLCKHPKLTDLVAMKLLYPQTNEREVQRFLTQSAMLNALDHPHIIHIYDFGLTDNNLPYLVMNYAPRGTMRQNYPRGTRLPLAQVVHYIKQAADALQYVHEHQLVHRDVKPQNMLLGANNDVILNDFGTAIVSYSLVPNVVDFEGTVLYAAPEQLEGRALRNSDQYALAVMTYELLCGAWPFIGTFEEVTRKHLFEQPPTLRSKGIEVALAVEDVLQRALSKKASGRFPCIQDFATALEDAWMLDQTLRPSQAQQSPPRRQFRSPLPFHSEPPHP
jgi:eukaryotic-like serine/threonine-protein kinase